MALTTVSNAFGARSEVFAKIPKSINCYKLTANIATNVDIADLVDVNGLKPFLLSFAADADFFVKWNGTATIPSASITDGTAPEITPAQRALDSSITSFSIISSSDCLVFVSIFSNLS